MSQKPDRQWASKELEDYVNNLLITLESLYGQALMLKTKLVHHVDQGEGLTQEELVEVYAEIDRLFPRRVRKTPEGLDVPL